MKKESRIKRHKSIRKTISGTKQCPRLAVFRSSMHIFAQVIDDLEGKTIAFANDLKVGKEVKIKKAYEVGKEIAAKLLKIKIKKVVFDRGGFLYHGRVAEVARGAREGGLEF